MKIKFIIIPIIAIVLQGCGSLFAGNTIPDETRVVDGPSLTIPPDFELKAPSELQKRDTSYKAAEKAKGVLLGAKKIKAMPKGNEGWLVKQAGTANSGIREQLEAEENAKKVTKKSTWFSNMWGGDKEAEDEEKNHSH